MPPIEKNQLYELEILKHVEATPRLNNRLIAAKLGCSVKLAHELLGKMVSRGLLHVTKLHSRRWDYFLTPQGLIEKAKITCEFISFSHYFYREARKASSMLCRRLHEQGISTVAFIGTGDLAEIVYLGVKQWELELVEVFDQHPGEFFGIAIQPLQTVAAAQAQALIICVYDEHYPMIGPKLPPDITQSSRMYWLFDKKYYKNQ
jgi:hypothetical protein